MNRLQPLKRLDRTTILIWVMVFFGVLLTVRLFYVQIIRHNYYQAQGESEHVSKFTIPANRGTIYARDGADALVPLVLNEPAFLAFADPRYVDDPARAAAVLRRVAGGNLVGDIDKSLGQKDRQYVVLARQLSKQQKELIKKEDLTGIGFQEFERRVYPEGSLAAQTLGYVNAEGKGQYGLEQAIDDQLRGKNGMLRAVTDVNGIPIGTGKDNVETPAKHGQDTVLTLDRNVQAYAEQALKAGLERVRANNGSIVVLNPENGAVIAMANHPTYDPAKYYEVEDFRVLQNKVVTDPYESGSVMKVLTMAVGLNEGKVAPGTTYTNTGSVKVDDATIKNVLNVNGNRTMTDVLQYSLNTGVVDVLRRLGGSDRINGQGRRILFDYFSNRYMFGKRTGIEQAGESPGVIISPDQVQGNNVRYANMTFGQGVDTTMIQVASAFSAAVNGGNYFKPHVVEGQRRGDGSVLQKQPELVKGGVVSPQTSEMLRGMMREARQKNAPTADKKGYFVGGKTGTSQIIDPKTGKYIDNNAIGTYLGFGGGGNSTPKYVIMVRVVDAKISGYAGSEAALPIFTDVSNWLLDYLNVQPQ